jgi:hypothetical protein
MMLEYKVSARRIDSHGSAAIAKDAEITLDTDMAGRRDGFSRIIPGICLTEFHAMWLAFWFPGFAIGFLAFLIW